MSQSNNPGLKDFVIPVPANHAGQGELWLQPTTEKHDPLLGQTMLSEGNDTISQELGTHHWFQSWSPVDDEGMYKTQSGGVAGLSAGSHTSETCGGVSAVLQRRREIYDSQEQQKK